LNPLQHGRTVLTKRRQSVDYYIQEVQYGCGLLQDIWLSVRGSRTTKGCQVEFEKSAHLSSEIVALFDGSRLYDTHPSPDVVFLDAPGEDAHLVPGIRLLQDLVEHLDARHSALACSVVANHFDVLANLTRTLEI
jgi:hypothetical protein